MAILNSSGRQTGIRGSLDFAGGRRSTAVQAIKNLILCAGYTEEFDALGLLGCWEMLLSPDSLFQAISHLAREKTIGMIFFSELLYHPEVGHHFTMRHILDVLHKWMTQPDALIQIFSLRGLGYLLQHPLE
ncbi:hypothetical protein L345_15464, partial [Ophiophagus hannah]